MFCDEIVRVDETCAPHAHDPVELYTRFERHADERLEWRLRHQPRRWTRARRRRGELVDQGEIPVVGLQASRLSAA